MIRIDSEKERKKGGHLPSAAFGRQGVYVVEDVCGEGTVVGTFVLAHGFKSFAEHVVVLDVVGRDGVICEDDAWWWGCRATRGIHVGEVSDEPLGDGCALQREA